MIYTPREDSYLIENQVKKYAKDKSFLDIGTGSGILALSAQSFGAKSVLASDINQESVNSVNKLKLPIQVIQSDLFSNIRGKFDLIAFNPPYLPKDENEDEKSALSTSGGKLGDELVLRFLNNAGNRLASNGNILLLLSSLTPRERIISTLKNKHLNYEILDKQKLFMESLEVWKISAN